MFKYFKKQFLSSRIFRVSFYFFEILLPLFIFLIFPIIFDTPLSSWMQNVIWGSYYNPAAYPYFLINLTGVLIVYLITAIGLPSFISYLFSKRDSLSEYQKKLYNIKIFNYVVISIFILSNIYISISSYPEECVGDCMIGQITAFFIGTLLLTILILGISTIVFILRKITLRNTK